MKNSSHYSALTPFFSWRAILLVPAWVWRVYVNWLVSRPYFSRIVWLYASFLLACWSSVGTGTPVAGTFWAWINGCHMVGLQPIAVILASLSYSTCLFIALTSRANRKSTAKSWRTYQKLNCRCSGPHKTYYQYPSACLYADHRRKKHPKIA